MFDVFNLSHHPKYKVRFWPIRCFNCYRIDFKLLQTLWLRYEVRPQAIGNMVWATVAKSKVIP